MTGTDVSAAPKREFDQILSGNVTIRKICNSDNGEEYKIKFSKKDISDGLLYQVWTSTSPRLNGSREVFEFKATKWVKAAFRKIEGGNVPVPNSCITTKVYAPVFCKDGKKYNNSSLAACASQNDCKPYVPYAPTCVMELHDGECPIHHKGKDCDHGECRHVFVINNAKVKDGRVIFYVSSKDIDLNNKNKVIKKIKKIPQGKLFHNARFDINGRLEQYWNCTASLCPDGSTSVSNNVILALDFFISKVDYTQEQAAGIVAGLMGESGTNLDPTVVNPTSGAYGLAQWLGSRMANLKEFAATNGKPYSDFNVQLEFIALEMKLGDKYTDFSASYIKYSTSPQESLAAMAIYERWAYIDSLYYKNDNSYQNVYNIILNEINNGTSPDGSLNSRIGYLNTLLKYLASSNAMTIE
jgi:hypothetical protein